MNVNARCCSFGRCLAVLVISATLSGCGSHPNQDAAATAQAQELEQLRKENEGLAQARTENEEVRKLQQANESLPKLRSQYQEVGRIRKENDQLRQQLGKLSPGAATQALTSATARTGGIASAGTSTNQEPDHAAEEAAMALNDGDDIMVDPKELKALLPDFDWEKLGRKEPLGVRALVEKDGVILTNALQLREYGITNFVIQRAARTNIPQSPIVQ